MSREPSKGNKPAGNDSRSQERGVPSRPGDIHSPAEAYRLAAVGLGTLFFLMLPSGLPLAGVLLLLLPAGIVMGIAVRWLLRNDLERALPEDTEPDSSSPSEG